MAAQSGEIWAYPEEQIPPETPERLSTRVKVADVWNRASGASAASSAQRSQKAPGRPASKTPQRECWKRWNTWKAALWKDDQTSSHAPYQQPAKFVRYSRFVVFPEHVEPVLHFDAISLGPVDALFCWIHFRTCCRSTFQTFLLFRVRVGGWLLSHSLCFTDSDSCIFLVSHPKIFFTTVLVDFFCTNSFYHCLVL